MKLTKGQRTERAMNRLEERVADLLHAADAFSLTGRTLYDMRAIRAELLHAARLYTNALRALSRGGS